MKKVLVITYYWPPAGGPGVQRWLKLTKYLAELQVEVHVLTVRPENATYPLRDTSLLGEVNQKVRVHATATRELFSLYKRASGRKEVPFSGFANESDRPGPRQKLSRFIRGNFFLPDARKSWNRYAYAEAARIIKKEGISTVITTSPPHSTQLIGLKLKRELGLRWIADFRDPWTDIYYYKKFYPTALAKKIDRKWERQVLEGADEVITVSADLKRLFLEKSSHLKTEHFHVIPNGFDPDDFRGTVEKDASQPFTILYAGTLTDQYPIEAFLIQLRQSHIKTKVRLRFIGRRDEKSQKTLMNFDGDLAIEMEDYIPKDRLNIELLRSDALLLVIPDIENNKGILTGKLFDYIGAKKPIIAIGPPLGDAGELIKQCEAGAMFGYDDYTGLENLLTEWLTKPENFKPAIEVVNSFSRQKQAQQIVSLII